MAADASSPVTRTPSCHLTPAAFLLVWPGASVTLASVGMTSAGNRTSIVEADGQRRDGTASFSGFLVRRLCHHDPSREEHTHDDEETLALRSTWRGRTAARGLRFRQRIPLRDSRR